MIWSENRLPISIAEASPDVNAFRAVREMSRHLCEHLDPEDLVPQSMPDASPLKWHLAHTTWFFEIFVLARFDSDHTPYHPQFSYLFNSYYNQIGDRQKRAERGLLTRPTTQEVFAYRAVIDEAVCKLLEQISSEEEGEFKRILEIGLQHEQQHQELVLTDLKHLFAHNALRPAYRMPLEIEANASPGPQGWIDYEEGLYEVGHDGASFAFDNEGPRHKIYLEAFSLGNRLITNGEYLDFIEDGGYSRPEFWLDAGWTTLKEEAWRHPFYWQEGADGWQEFTLSGPRSLGLSEPICHVSYFEADAFSRWAGARLPTEFEWEVACAPLPNDGNFLETGRFHPGIARDPKSNQDQPSQCYGDVWEWTSSPYSAYPGYQTAAGALGEYNGKFMSGQMVLRGGSCATPARHIRATYRNFFAPGARWQFSGLRLARKA